MFRSHALIIHKQKIRDGQTRLVLFTREYGRVTVWSKKPMTPGSGSIVEAQIDRIGNQNHIKHIDTLKTISGEWWKYEEVHLFLELLQSLYELLPDSSAHTSIYDDLALSIYTLEGSLHKSQFFLLLHIRILKKLGSFRDANCRQDRLCQYIYTHIDTKKIDELLHSKVIHPAQSKLLQRSVQESRHFALI